MLYCEPLTQKAPSIRRAFCQWTKGPKLPQKRSRETYYLRYFAPIDIYHARNGLSQCERYKLTMISQLIRSNHTKFSTIFHPLNFPILFVSCLQYSNPFQTHIFHPSTREYTNGNRIKSPVEMWKHSSNDKNAALIKTFSQLAHDCFLN